MVTRVRTDFVTAKEAAVLLHLSKWSVYRWLKRGWLDGVMLPNGTIRITLSSINQALGK